MLLLKTSVSTILFGFFLAKVSTISVMDEHPSEPIHSVALGRSMVCLEATKNTNIMRSHSYSQLVTGTVHTRREHTALMQLSMCSPSIPRGELCRGSTGICVASRSAGVGILIFHFVH